MTEIVALTGIVTTGMVSIVALVLNRHFRGRLGKHGIDFETTESAKSDID